MTEIRYQEPEYIREGIGLYREYERNEEKGNFISIVSNALRVVREKGPAGLLAWMEADEDKRSFLQTISDLETYNRNNASVEYTSRFIDRCIKILCYAKQYAKTQD